LLFTVIFWSGTRALMLAACGVVLFVLVYKMSRVYFWRGIVPIFALMSIVVIFYATSLFLSEKTETSNVIKMGHINSYKELFKSEPSILFLGQGAGSLFYSSGFKEYVSQTEWSYVEMLRMFGVFGFIWILILYLYPALKIWQQRHNILLAIPFLTGYLFYFLVAGTNPLLLGSNGLLMLLIAYSFAYNPSYRVTYQT
jgi:hypothetical protein